jgi:S-phase kinase-associated protein 1
MVKVITNDGVVFDVSNETATYKLSDYYENDPLIGVVSTSIEMTQDEDDDDEVLDDAPILRVLARVQAAVPIPNVGSVMFKHVMEYCDHYVSHPMKIIEKPMLSYDMKDNVEYFYANFIDSLTTVEVFEVLLAANFLDVKPLSTLAGSKIGSLIKGKTSAEVKELMEWMTTLPIDQVAVKIDKMVTDDKIEKDKRAAVAAIVAAKSAEASA